VSAFGAALATEALKARRSRVPVLTAAAFSLIPIVDALFMFILKDPERARSMGLLSTKAQLVGEADWPTMMGLLGQATAVGGLLVMAMAASWLFGREFADRTLPNVLATRTPRATIVLAKFAVFAFWSAGLIAIVPLLGLAGGLLVGIPGWSTAVAVGGVRDVLVAGCMTAAITTPVAFVASSGRGYLAPMGWALMTLVLAQIVAVTGWGSWFPWAVPALYGGLAGDRALQLGPHSYVIVGLAGAAGIVATVAWWRNADHG
jgi:ABC-2 type transport system permease protein